MVKDLRNLGENDHNGLFEGLGSPASIPILNVDTNIMALSLSSTEAFLLSRVDGSSTLDDLVAQSGIGEEQSVEALKSLCRMGAIVILSPSPSPRRDVGRGSRPPVASGPEPLVGVPLEAPVSPEEFGYDPGELEEKGVELPLDLRKSILYVYHNLTKMDYYRLLELDPPANKRDLSRAYRRVCKVYHPDQYFRKSLGSYRERVEAIFRAIHEAYSYLQNDGARGAYELSLRQQRPLPPGPELVAEPMAEPVTEPAPQPAQGLSADRQARLERLQRVREEARRLEEEAMRRQQEATLVAAGEKDEAEREERLRLMKEEVKQRRMEKRKTWPPQDNARKPPSPPPEDGRPKVSEEQTAKELTDKRRLLRRQNNPLLEMVEKGWKQYQAAQREIKQGKLKSGLAALRLAMNFDPRNESYKSAHEELTIKLFQEEAQGMVLRAQEGEAKGGKDKPLKDYIRAAEICPSGDILGQAAEAILRLGGDLELAASLAERGSRRPDKNANIWRALARIQEKRGKIQEAVAALEEYLKHRPHVTEARMSLLRLRDQLKRGG